MTYPLVLDLAADGIPVAVTCRVLGFSKQSFYEWRAKPVTARDWDDAHLIDAAIAIHAEDPAFGYRFIAEELPDHGITAGENRVQRLCSAQRLFSVHSKKRGLNRRPGPSVHDDLVERDFTAGAPNELWLTDLTEHRTDEGKLYLCAIKDVYSNRIVGYSIDSRMKASLAVTALRSAVARRGTVTGCVVHSDRGSQFRARKFVHELTHHGLVGSMGKGRGVRGQRRHGVLFRPTPEERPGPATLVHPGGPAAVDRDLDREDLSPPAPPTPSGSPHAGRV